MSRDYALLPQGDRAISVVFREEISPEINRRVTALCAALDAARPRGVLNSIPAYHTLTVEYDPMQLSYGAAARIIKRCVRDSRRLNGEESGRLIEVPVCYGGEYGPDLALVAQRAGISEGDVIAIHSSPEYRVYMLGFRPGFPYLGGLDERIATPRLATPRLRIAAGSVGIAGAQTGIYPEESPGGWNIIGRTPLTLFSFNKLVLLNAGDALRFRPIDAAEFERIAREEAGI